jgi:P27 family predicted phage terminase small subunit
VLKLARGNPGRRPLPDAEPDLAPAASDAPADVCKDKGALAEWNRLFPELEKKGVLTVGDQTIFAGYCKITAEIGRYERLCARVGLANAHLNGYKGYLLKLRIQLRQYAAELGLTPSSRSGVKAVKAPEQEDAKRRRFFGAGSSHSA